MDESQAQVQVVLHFNDRYSKLHERATYLISLDNLAVAAKDGKLFEFAKAFWTLQWEQYAYYEHALVPKWIFQRWLAERVVEFHAESDMVNRRSAIRNSLYKRKNEVLAEVDRLPNSQAEADELGERNVVLGRLITVYDASIDRLDDMQKAAEKTQELARTTWEIAKIFYFQQGDFKIFADKMDAILESNDVSDAYEVAYEGFGLN